MPTLMACSWDMCGVLKTPRSVMNSVVRSMPVPKATELGPVRPSLELASTVTVPSGATRLTVSNGSVVV